MNILQSIKQCQLKLSPKQVLQNFGNYIGRKQLMKKSVYILKQIKSKKNLRKQKIDKQTLEYIPSIVKLFDQILAFITLNPERNKTIKEIDITVDNNLETFVIKDNGKNKFPRNCQSIVICNIFSVDFYIQIGDAASQLVYSKKWQNNMKVERHYQEKVYESAEDFIKILFIPDYNQLESQKLKNDTRIRLTTLQILRKRAFDVAGALSRHKTAVIFNGQCIRFQNFKEYVQLYTHKSLIFDESSNNEQCQLYISKSDSNFECISFINGVLVQEGNHVTQIKEQINVSLLNKLKGKHMRKVPFRFFIDRSFKFFINMEVRKPLFEYDFEKNINLFTSKPKDYDKWYKVSEYLQKQLCSKGYKKGIERNLKLRMDNKLINEVKKQAKQRQKFHKYDEAWNAGISGETCTLIITGDNYGSVSQIVLEELGRQNFGVYHVKKQSIINACNKNWKQILGNFPYKTIINVMNLQPNKVYNSTEFLRYKKILVMMNRDNQSNFIIANIINFFAHLWPELMEIKQFFGIINIPKFMCSKGEEEKQFYNLQQYQKWKKHADEQYHIKQYWSLASFSEEQIYRYFSDLNNHLTYIEPLTSEDKEILKIIFTSQRDKQKKEWIINFQNKKHKKQMKYGKTITIRQFMNKEYAKCLISFKGVPSMIDGLKPLQRRILFTCFEEKVYEEITVLELAGLVVNKTNTKQGEKKIVNQIYQMARKYIGSNNYNLLEPIGQFGSRNIYEYEGRDHINSQYVHTHLNPLTRQIFNPLDDYVIQYQLIGKKIKPKYFLPILPMTLVKGFKKLKQNEGVRTVLYPYKIQDVLEMIKHKLETEELIQIPKGYEGWKGDIIKNQQEKKGFQLVGKYSLDLQNNTAEIYELPIGTNLRNYKDFLLDRMKFISNNKKPSDQLYYYSVLDNHQGENISFIVHFIQGKIPPMDSINDHFKLIQNIPNEHLQFKDSNNQIKVFESVEKIIEQFYQFRLEGYRKRKQFLLSKFQRQMRVLNQQIRFIDINIENVGLMKSQNENRQWFESNDFEEFEHFPKIKSSKPFLTKIEALNNRKFNYLLNMPFYKFNLPYREALYQKMKSIEFKKQQLTVKSQKQMWSEDLAKFQRALNQRHSFSQNFLKRIKRSQFFDQSQEHSRKRFHLNENDDNFDYYNQESSDDEQIFRIGRLKMINYFEDFERQKISQQQQSPEQIYISDDEKKVKKKRINVKRTTRQMLKARMNQPQIQQNSIVQRRNSLLSLSRDQQSSVKHNLNQNYSSYIHLNHSVNHSQASNSHHFSEPVSRNKELLPEKRKRSRCESSYLTKRKTKKAKLYEYSEQRIMQKQKKKQLRLLKQQGTNLRAPPYFQKQKLKQYDLDNPYTDLYICNEKEKFDRKDKKQRKKNKKQSQFLKKFKSQKSLSIPINLE